MTDYLVTLNEPGPYRIGVDYEIPTKSIQYGNIILDNINSQFTGVAHTFGLAATGTAYVPINDQQLIVVKNNLVMEPIEDYTTSTNNIIFTVAPNPGDLLTFGAGINAGKLVKVDTSGYGPSVVIVGTVIKFDSGANFRLSG